MFDCDFYVWVVSLIIVGIFVLGLFCLFVLVGFGLLFICSSLEFVVAVVACGLL